MSDSLITECFQNFQEITVLEKIKKKTKQKSYLLPSSCNSILKGLSEPKKKKIMCAIAYLHGFLYSTPKCAFENVPKMCGCAFVLLFCWWVGKTLCGNFPKVFALYQLRNKLRLIVFHWFSIVSVYCALEIESTPISYWFLLGRMISYRYEIIGTRLEPASSR